ncbi:hypothetical protein P9112_008719 [Eukaryota sp. TZLM1-RC]
MSTESLSSLSSFGTYGTSTLEGFNSSIGSTFSGLSMGSTFGASMMSTSSVKSIRTDPRKYSQWSSFRRFCHQIVEHRHFSNIILLIIFLNTIIITLQTSIDQQIAFGFWFDLLDAIFLGIYLAEAFIKLYVWRGQYFSSGWNLFDFFIILVSVASWIQLGTSTEGTNLTILRLVRVFRAIRALRALRSARVVNFFSSLRIMVSLVLKSLPALGSIAFLLGILLFIFAIIGTELYRDIQPFGFGSLGATAFTLFQFLTLDDWFEHYEEVQDEDTRGMVIFCILFILVETFVLINLFVAVIVNNLEASQKVSAIHRKKSKEKKRLKKLRKLEEVDINELLNDEDSNFNQSNSNSVIRDLEFYYGNSLPLKERQLLSHYLMLLTTVDSLKERLAHSESLLNKLIDFQNSKN